MPLFNFLGASPAHAMIPRLTEETALAFLIFLALATAVVYQSPKKLHTLGRIVLALVVTILLIIIPAAIVHRGNPHLMGSIAALIGFCVALVVGWWHVRSLKRIADLGAQGPLG
jgi:hypothetical protein